MHLLPTSRAAWIPLALTGLRALLSSTEPMDSRGSHRIVELNSGFARIRDGRNEPTASACKADSPSLAFDMCIHERGWV